MRPSRAKTRFVESHRRALLAVVPVSPLRIGKDGMANAMPGSRDGADELNILSQVSNQGITYVSVERELSADPLSRGGGKCFGRLTAVNGSVNRCLRNEAERGRRGSGRGRAERLVGSFLHSWGGQTGGEAPV